MVVSARSAHGGPVLLAAEVGVVVNVAGAAAPSRNPVGPLATTGAAFELLLATGLIALFLGVLVLGATRSRHTPPSDKGVPHA